MGEFQLCSYGNSQDNKEHLALVAGNVRGQEDVLVRIHSECLTGDVLGSLRCDCGPQLQKAIQIISEKGAGVIIYLRQEGRGIGLLDKLRAYNLQDDGYDTVEANLILGHQADGRDYTMAALILQDLGISSVQLITNNHNKIESLCRCNVDVTARVPLQTSLNQENMAYLKTKARRMRHMLDLEPFSMLLTNNEGKGSEDAAELPSQAAQERPYVTLSYAQSLDGLNPQPVIVDSQLRCPLHARLLQNDHAPWIATTEDADAGRQYALESVGARVLRLPSNKVGQVDLQHLLLKLSQLGIKTLIVEGGAAIISSFLSSHLVDRLVLTIAPMLVGGLNAIEPHHESNGSPSPRLFRTRYRMLGNDIVLVGDLG
jgi:3,4-dihydroxy 2-butanone 4-phosphate synthase/GTP cyclohydrolase II